MTEKQSNYESMKSDQCDKFYVSADYLLDNAWASNIEGWYEAVKDGKCRQFVRIRLDIASQTYVVDAVGQDLKCSEALWRYKGGDWLFLSHND